MFLERKNSISLYQLQSQVAKEDIGPGLENQLESLWQLIEMQQVYSSAMSELGTKLDILDDEFQLHHKHNPIHHMERRLKQPKSIFDKMKQRGLPLNIETARKEIYDIAGIRVVCNYIEDVYAIEELLLFQSDIKLIQRKDYIHSPKPNGYRSLHLIVTVPVFLSDHKEDIPVEIQIRTIAMDYWAGLEHRLCYKNMDEATEAYAGQLKTCAEQLSAIEQSMQQIHRQIDRQIN